MIDVKRREPKSRAGLTLKPAIEPNPRPTAPRARPITIGPTLELTPDSLSVTAIMVIIRNIVPIISARTQTPLLAYLCG